MSAHARPLSDDESCNLFLLAVGALAPLETYMTAEQYRACLASNGAPMQLPVTFLVHDKVAVGDTITLTAKNDIVDVCATLRVCETYAPDARFHADGVYVTGDLHVERCAGGHGVRLNL